MGNKYINLDDAINYISTQMVLRNLNITKDNEKEDFKDQNKLKFFLMEVQKNSEAVKDNINAIYNTIQQENPGISLPKNFLIDIANYVALEVDLNGLASPSQIAALSGSTVEIFRNTLSYKSDNIKKENSNIENIIIGGAIFEITKEGLENFQANMQEKYKDNYFKPEDFEKVKEVSKEVISIVGKDNLETKIQEANNRNLEAACKVVIIQNAQIKMGYYSNVDKISEDKMLDYIKDMIFLSDSTDLPEIEALYEKMTEKLPDSEVEIDENGRKYISVEKLKEMYKARNNGVDIDMEFHKKVYEDLAQEYIENEENHFKNGAEDFLLENIIEGQEKMLAKNYNICVEEKKSPENYKYAMYELRKNSKKYLDASLRLVESLSLSGVEPFEQEVYEELRDSVLEGLAEAKDGEEFDDDEYVKKSKKNWFESDIKRKIENKESVDENLLRKMVKADSEISKEILKNILERQNTSPSQVTGEYIQALNNAIKADNETERGTVEDRIVETESIKREIPDVNEKDDFSL